MLSLLSGTEWAGHSLCKADTGLLGLVSFPLGALGSVCAMKVASRPALRLEQSEGHSKGVELTLLQRRGPRGRQRGRVKERWRQRGTNRIRDQTETERERDRNRDQT